MSNVQICEICKSTNFDIIDGNFFCTQCLTQNQNVQENVREARYDATTRLKSLGKAKTQKADKPIEGWTSWELYNFILHGLTNEIIELGAPSAIKLTVLQLWTYYLKKLEVAFTSTKKRNIPKLSRKFHKSDAQIIYGKIQKRKRRRSKSASSVISSHKSTGSGSRRTTKKSLENSLAEEYEKASSTNDSLSSLSANQSLVSLQSSFSQGSSTKTRLKFNKGARVEAKKVKVLSKKIPNPRRGKYRKEYVTTMYKVGPQVISAMKLWGIIYLALRIHDVNLHLSDMIRYGKEGHLSYYKLDHLIPPEVTLTKKNIKLITPINELTHKGLRQVAAGLANLLDVEFDLPNLLSLAEQFCKELQLPKCMTPSIIVHGGVGDCNDSIMIEKMVSCQKAASVGYEILMKGRNANDAAETALSWFEDDEFFNCGYGSVLNEIGDVQMDASMMDGNKLEIGSVAAVSDIEHPISLAKYVMEKYPNSIIVGDGAKKLAKNAGLNLVSKGNMIAPASYFAYKSAELGDSEVYNFDSSAVSEALKNCSDTVGCVVWDGHKIIAAASTGGLNKKLVGRVGDSPLLGCGVFATDRVGCCLTGHGESLIKAGLSRSIVNCVLSGQSLSEALQSNLDDLKEKTKYDSGGVVLEKSGSWDVYFTGTRMPYAFIRNNCITYGVDKGEKKTKPYQNLNIEKICCCK